MPGGTPFRGTPPVILAETILKFDAAAGTLGIFRRHGYLQEHLNIKVIFTSDTCDYNPETSLKTSQETPKTVVGRSPATCRDLSRLRVDNRTGIRYFNLHRRQWDGAFSKPA
jgi:hypothetical protein